MFEGVVIELLYLYVQIVNRRCAVKICTKVLAGV